MPRSYPVNFRIHIPEPVEVKMLSLTLGARDAISPLERFKGLFTYVVEDDTFYYLSKGVTNSHWKPLATKAYVDLEIANAISDIPVKGFVAIIGDGSTASITVTHNLKSKNIIVQVSKNSGDENVVFVPIRKPNADSVIVDFAVPPVNNAYKITILKVE